jgi:hypothetical protein
MQHWTDGNWGTHHGFYTIADRTLFKLPIAKIRECTAPTEFVWVKGPSGVAENELADALVGEGRLKPDADVINVSAQMVLILLGAKLKAMAQSKAYKIIKKLSNQGEYGAGPGWGNRMSEKSQLALIGVELV